MSLFAFLPIIGDILDKVLPDKTASEQAKLKLMELTQQGNLAELNAMVELTKAQTDTNIAEANSGGRFKGGWRPMIGYVCAASLAYNYIGYPMLLWATAIWWPGHSIPPSPVDDHMWELIMGMLGLGFARSWEKRKP